MVQDVATTHVECSIRTQIITRLKLQQNKMGALKSLQKSQFADAREHEHIHGFYFEEKRIE